MITVDDDLVTWSEIMQKQTENVQDVQNILQER